MLLPDRAPGATLRGLCLTGPTAAGKTAAAMALARRLPVEIISVDSALVYRGMDIGTAKPSTQERAEVPHHLIDICDPSESYSAARFAADAARLIDEIRARGNWPLLVGGTMLYFRALRDGLNAMPGADAQIRARIDAEAAALGWPALHAELAKVDPITAQRLPPNDAQRIQRALEVWRISGRPLSHWHESAPESAGGRDSLPMLSLEPGARAWLHQRIAQRWHAMVAAGFVEEVLRLRQRGDLHAGLPSVRCVGYRQVWLALDGAGLRDRAQGNHEPASATGAALAPATQEAAIAATRQLAKRQLTWLRATPQRHVLPAEAVDVATRVCDWAQAQIGAAR